MKYIKHESYEEYRDSQIKTNKAKLGMKWVLPEHMRDIKKYCDTNNIEVKSILCHGTRNGAEISYFNNVFGDISIIGTDISDTATQFPNTIQWDFHEMKEEWKGQFEIVFTNSWDHAYDFEKALKGWMESLSANGRLFLDANEDTSKPWNKSDCCGCSTEELVELLNVNYCVESTFTISNRYNKDACMVVVKNK